MTIQGVCAWVEGFADWYGSAVLNNPDIPGNRGNIETATFGTPGWDDGDQVEGRVAGALWDLFEAPADGSPGDDVRAVLGRTRTGRP